MIDIEDRVTTMLTEAAGRIDVSRDLAAITDDHQFRLPSERPAPRRRVALTMSIAGLGVVLVVGLAIVATRHQGDTPLDESPSTAPSSVPTDLFPVIDNPPAWAGAMYGSYRIPDSTPAPRVVVALLARDGSGQDVVDPIVVSVRAELPEGVRTGGTPVDVDGRPGRIVTFSKGDSGNNGDSGNDGDSGNNGDATPPTLVVDGSPVILVSGRVDESVLEQIASAVTVSNPETDFTISIGEPPTGFVVVVPPSVQPTPVLSAAASSDDSALDVAVNGNLPDPRFPPALSGETATAAQIGDVVGWYSNGPSAGDYTVAWEPRPGTIVVLTASHSGLTSNDVIELARNTRLTDEDEWRTTYGVEANPLPESPEPVIGQPMPTFDDCQSPYVTTDSPSCD